MYELILIFGIIGIWLLLQLFVLPKLGVDT
jgi:hypothetical protein